MAKTATAPGTLSKGTKVVARTDLRDVPTGTTGKVSMVTGLTWIRYWVRFDNGVSLGTIDRKRLATKDEWQRIQDGFDDSADEATPADGAADSGAADESDGGGVTTPNGTLVPQKFIDRAKAARARLAA